MTVDLSAFDRARPYVSRVVGWAVGAVLAVAYVKLGARFGAPIPQDPMVAEILATGLVGLVYSLVHRAVDSKVNPADAAKVVTAAAGAASPIGSVSEGAAAKAVGPLDVPPPPDEGAR